MAEFSVIVEDVNDNAPYLNMPNGLVWPENTPPGTDNTLRSSYTYNKRKSAILIGICAHRQFSQAEFAHIRKQRFSKSIARIIFLWMSDFNVVPSFLKMCRCVHCTKTAAFVGLFPSRVCPVAR